MKIAFLSNTTFNIYNFRLGLMRFLQQQGFVVVFIAPEDEYVDKMKASINAEYIPLKSMSRKGYNPLQELNLLRELHGIFKREQIDLVLSYTIKPNIYAPLASYFTSTKVIANITGLGFVFLKNSFGNFFVKKLLPYSLKKASKVVFQNQEDQTLFIDKKYVESSKSVLINGSGINVGHYVPAPIDPNKKTFQFLFVGRLLFDKGVREFVQASFRLQKEFSNVSFHLVGSLDDGNPSAVSEQQLADWLTNNPQLLFHDHQTNVIPFINQADVVVLPSYREGIPRVLLEAMAMKKPFITAQSAGCKDVTSEGFNGFLVPVADAEALYHAMKKMMLMPLSDRITMGENGYQRVLEKYDEKIIVQEYLKLILPLT